MNKKLQSLNNRLRRGAVPINHRLTYKYQEQHCLPIPFLLNTLKSYTNANQDTLKLPQLIIEFLTLCIEV